MIGVPVDVQLASTQWVYGMTIWEACSCKRLMNSWSKSCLELLFGLNVDTIKSVKWLLRFVKFGRFIPCWICDIISSKCLSCCTPVRYYVNRYGNDGMFYMWYFPNFYLITIKARINKMVHKLLQTQNELHMTILKVLWLYFGLTSPLISEELYLKTLDQYKT